MFGIFNKKIKIDHRRSDLFAACSIDDLEANLFKINEKVLTLGVVNKNNINKLKLTEEERLSMALFIMKMDKPHILLEIVNIFAKKKFTKETKTLEFLYHNLNDLSLVSLTLDMMKKAYNGESSWG